MRCAFDLFGVDIEDVLAAACTSDCARYRAGACAFVWPSEDCTRVYNVARLMADKKKIRP